MNAARNFMQLRIATELRLTLGIVAFVGAILPVRGVACAMGLPEHNVTRNFVVRVSYNGHPLPGIETEIYRENDTEPYLVVAVSTKTDEKGQSSISALPPGPYFLVVRHAGVDGEALELKVVADEQADAFVEEELELNWPHKKVFKVRQLAGTLIRTPFDNRTKSAETPLANSKLTLVEALPATLREASVVKDDGSFAFIDIPSGLYIVRVKQDKGTKPSPPAFEDEIEGAIFVEVGPNAVDREIPPLHLYMSDCGMGMRGVDGNEIF